VLARQRGGIHVDPHAVLPVGQAHPLDLRLVVAPVRIGHQLRRQHVRLHRAGHARGQPLRGARIRSGVLVAGQQAHLPAGIQRLHARRRGPARAGQEQREDTQSDRRQPGSAPARGHARHRAHAAPPRCAAQLRPVSRFVAGHHPSPPVSVVRWRPTLPAARRNPAPAIRAASPTDAASI